MRRGKNKEMGRGGDRGRDDNEAKGEEERQQGDGSGERRVREKRGQRREGETKAER